jgi:hypothetical protein
MSFDSLLYYVCKRCIAFYKFCNEKLGAEYDINKVMKRVIKLLNTYKKHGVTEALVCLRNILNVLTLIVVLKYIELLSHKSYMFFDL